MKIKRFKATFDDGNHIHEIIVDLDVTDAPDCVNDFDDLVEDALGPIVDRGIDDAGNPVANVNFDGINHVDVVEVDRPIVF